MTTPKLTYRQVLLIPHVGALLGSALCSRLAEQMFTLVLVLHALDVFESPALAGVVVFASIAPGLIVSPMAGALLDRIGATRAILADLMASAVLVGALAFVPGGIVPVVVLAVLYSLTSPLNIAGVRALLPRLVPDPALERANALDIGLFNLVEVLGPVLAGTLFALAGGQVAMVVVAVLYALACVFMLTLPAGRPEHADRGPLLRSTVESVRYVLTHPVLRALVVSYGLYQVAWGVLVVAVPTVVGSARAGLLWGAAGVAGIVGALIVGHVLREGRERAAMVVGTAITAVGATVAVGGIAGMAVGLVAVGLASGLVNVGLLTLRQRRTDPAKLGRVLAVSISLNVMGMPIGSALGGFVIERSAALAFVLAGVAAALGAVAVRVLVPKETKGVRDVSNALRAMPPRPQARLRLVCLPFAGGAASVFRQWQHTLPDDVEVIGVQYPGREDRIAEPALRDFGQLLDHIDAATEGLLDRPVALYGHSLGAALAYELAARWENTGQPPVHLFVSAAVPPHLPQRSALFDTPQDRLHDQVEQIYGGLPPTIAAHPELVELMMRVLAADLAAAGTYHRPRPVRRLRCPITAVAAESDRVVSPGEVSGWADSTAEEFTFHLVEGHHLFVRDTPESVAQIVGNVLGQPERSNLKN